MKIAHVCPRYYPDIGGVETHVREISERLVKTGLSVEVICTDPSGNLPRHETINSVIVTRFKSVAPGDAYFFAPQIFGYLRGQTYDIIHAHSYHAFPALFAMLAKNGRSLIFTPHYHREGHTFIRNLLHKPYKLIGSKIFEKADKVICVSDFEKRNILSDFRITPEKIEKIPNGIDLAEILNSRHDKKPEGLRTLLYVGRLEKYKGIQYIIAALAQLRDFKLKIIGKGPFEKNLRELSRDLSVTERIDWFKDLTREEILKHYASSDVFLMLSRHEAYGITVAEALASGLPCIVAMGSALEEFVDGKTCVGLNYPINTERLVNAIKNISSMPAKRYNNIMDWNDVTKLLIKIYEGK